MAKRPSQKSVTDNFVDALGMSTNVYNPGPKTARRLLNVHSNDEPGKLTIRPGYSLKYTAPTMTNLENAEFMDFALFFDRQLDTQTGREITCLIQKATMKHLSISDATDNDDLKGFWFWVRPYVDAGVWKDQWSLLNNTIITSISTAPDATYQSMMKIYAGEDNIIDDQLVGWTIYNKSKQEYSKIITCKNESSTVTRINIAFYNNAWEATDILVIHKFFVDPNYQSTLYNTVNKEDIAFHNLPNDLRVSFGGNAGIPSFAIGYRNKYFKIEKADFTNLHSDITDSALKEFAKVNQILLDTNLLFPSAYDLVLTGNSNISSETFDAGKYYFRLTGKADGYEEQLLIEKSITLSEPSTIGFQLIKYLGRDNSRLTDIKLYFQNYQDYQSYNSYDYGGGDLNYYLLEQFPVTDKEFLQEKWVINSDGELVYDTAGYKTIYNMLPRYPNPFGGDAIWPEWGAVLNAPYGASRKKESNSIQIQNGVYGAYFAAGAVKISSLKKNKIYRIHYEISFNVEHINYNIKMKFCWIKTINEYFCEIYDTGFDSISLGEFNDTPKSGYIDVEFPDTFHASEYNNPGIVLMEEPALYFEKAFEISEFYVEELPMADININTKLGTEISSELNYNSTDSLVSAWDFALELNGRIYYFNPYTTRRWANFVFVSHIHSDNSFMWDIASTSNYREIGLKSSDQIIGAVILPTTEILMIKDKSAQILQDDGLIGILREPIEDISCVARATIVVFNGYVLWCGLDEIYSFGGGGVKRWLRDTIRDVYSAINDKNLLKAVRDRFGSYRLRIYDKTNKTEFLLTENGWVEEAKYHYAVSYQQDFEGKLNFLATTGQIFGTVYSYENLGYGKLFASKFGPRL